MGMNASVYASAKSYGAVTKSDSTVLSFQAVYVGGAGDVAISPSEGDSGDAVTFAGLAAGTILPVKGRRVMSTNTTATNLVWLNW
jgi:hypothetical protein